MKITGHVRVDLSAYVNDGLLQFRDRDVVDLWRAAGDPNQELELDVGAAEWVHWPPRLIEALQDVARVRVVGSHRGGVEMAVRGLGRLVGEEPAGAA